MDPLYRVTRHQHIINESYLIKWTKGNACVHDLVIWSVEGLADMFDDDILWVGEHNTVFIEPFEVLNWLAGVVEDVLWHVGLRSMPKFQVSHRIDRLHDRAELVLAARDPSCLHHLAVLFDVEYLLVPRVRNCFIGTIGVHFVAVDTAAFTGSQQGVRYCGMPIEVGQLSLIR